LLLMPETPKWLRAVLLAAMLGAVGLLSLRLDEQRFDPDWWQLVHDGLAYLFPLEWRATDWARVLVVSTVLGAGLVVLESGARSVCRAALLAAWLGIALSIMGADWLRLLLPTQLQPWRMLWLSSTL